MALLAGFACLLTAIAAVGGSARAGAVTPRDLVAIHTIEISSQMGDFVAMDKVGFTVFSNRSARLPIADWRLNALVANEAAKALSGQFTVTIATDADTVPTGKAPNPLQTFTGQSERRFPPTPGAGVDAFLLFLPSLFTYGLSSTQESGALGLLHDPRASSDLPGAKSDEFSGTIFGTPHPKAAIVYALYDIYLVDARSGRVIASQQGQVRTRHRSALENLLPGAADAPIPYPAPHVYVSDGIWSDSADTMPDAQKQLLRDKLTCLLDNSVGLSLRGMGLPAADDPAITPSDCSAPPAG